MKVNIKAFNSEQLNVITNVLAWMEVCSNIGHCSEFTICIDGDGNGKVKTEFEDEKEQELFNKLKKDLLKAYQNGDFYNKYTESEEPVFAIGG